MFNEHNKYINISGAFFIYAIIGLSCSLKRKMPENVTRAIEMAQSNSQELLKVINHYSVDEKDSLKLKAAYFLIGNMPGKGFQKFELRNRANNPVNLNLFQLKNRDSIQQYKLAFEYKHNTQIGFVNLGFQQDLKFVTAEFLLENIEYAFKAWNLPWSKHLNFDQFCELILPYRMGEEPLQNWRKTFFEDYIWIADSIKSKEDLVKATCIINDKMKGVYNYRHGELDFYPGALTIEQVKDFGGGRCEDLNMFAAYCLRAVGIPIAFEITPFWSNSNYGGHSWLGLFNYDGKFVPFNAVYDNPTIGKLPFAGARLAKAFRTSFATQENSFASICPDSVKIPPFFRSKNFKDISGEYLQVYDVDVKFDSDTIVPRYAYLGVLNGKYWKPIFWSKTNGKLATFKNMASEVIYLPLFYEDKGDMRSKNYVVAGNPFFLRKNGQKEVLVPNKNVNNPLEFDFARLPWLIKGRQYQVMYWDKKDWIVDSSKHLLTVNPRSFKVGEKMLELRNVPNNTMYRIFSDSILSETSLGRPFIFDVDQGKYKDY